MANNKKIVLAGSFLSQPMADLLTLRSIYEEQSKSSLVRGLITAYLMTGATTEEMCQAIAERHLKMWLYIDDYKKYPWNEYLKKVEEDLKAHNLAETHIEQILQNMQKLREELNNGKNYYTKDKKDEKTK